MGSSLALLAFLPEKIAIWLTPLWVIGMGCLLALVGLMLLWAIVWGLSRVSALNRIAQDPQRRVRAGLILSVVIYVLLAALLLGPTFGAWQDLAERDQERALLTAILTVPISIVVSFGIIAFCSQSLVAEAKRIMIEGPMVWVLTVVLAMAAVGVVGIFAAQNSTGVLKSVARIPFVGNSELAFRIPGTPREVLDDSARDPEPHSIPIQFRTDEIRALIFDADSRLTVSSERGGEVDTAPDFEISPEETYQWIKSGNVSPFEDAGEVRELFVRNYGTSEAALTVKMITAPVHPEAMTIPLTAIMVLGIFLAYLIQRATLSKVSAVALATFKSEVAQPLFLIVLLLGSILLILFIFFPYNTFGEDIKMLKDSGMTLIMVLAIVQAIWAASTSVADEIDGRTALTVLSKPIGRRSFIIGKYVGIFWTVAVLFIVLGIVLLGCVSWKAIYDARETADQMPTWQVCHLEMVRVVPGLVLAFMETVVLAAISVAISTRLPMLANFILCFSIYVLGHLTPLVVQSSVSQFEAVLFVAELIATVLPNLDHFNIQAAVAAGLPVPYDYLGWAALYCLIYGVIALMLALVLFEDRDLA